MFTKIASQMKGITKLFTQYKGLSKSAYVLFIARLVTSMGAFIFPMLTLILTKKFGYSLTKAGGLMAQVSLILLVANVIGGKLADKFNRKKIIIIFDIISVAFFFVCAFVQPKEIMLYFLVASSFFATMEGPAFDALIAESTLPAEREKVFSLAYLGFNLGFMFGAAMAGLLFTNYLSLAFILDGLTTISSTLLIIIFVKVYKHDEIKAEDRNEYEDHLDHKHSILELLFSRKSILFFMLIAFIGAFIYQQWTFLIPNYMTHVFGDEKGPVYYGLIASFNGFVVIAFTPILTYLLRKKYELQKIILGASLMAVSFMIIFKTELLFMFFSFMFAFTIAEVINTIGNSPYLSRRVPGSHRGRLSSALYFFYFGGGMIGQVVSGIVIDNFGYDYMLILIVILGVTQALLVFFNYRLDKKIFPNLYKIPPSMMKTTLMKEQDNNIDFNSIP